MQILVVTHHHKSLQNLNTIHLMLLLIFRNNIVPRLHRISSVHKSNTTQILYVKYRGKVLELNAKFVTEWQVNMAWPYIIHKDLDKGRYCLVGKPFKQSIHCARLKRDPVVAEISWTNYNAAEDIVHEWEEFGHRDSGS